jgi:hypothetical protein
VCLCMCVCACVCVLAFFSLVFGILSDFDRFVAAESLAAERPPLPVPERPEARRHHDRPVICSSELRITNVHAHVVHLLRQCVGLAMRRQHLITREFLEQIALRALLPSQIRVVCGTQISTGPVRCS